MLSIKSSSQACPYPCVFYLIVPILCILPGLSLIALFNTQMPKLQEKFQVEMKDNAEVLACRFPLPDWKPSKVIEEGIDSVWLYKKPKVPWINLVVDRNSIKKLWSFSSSSVCWSGQNKHLKGQVVFSWEIKNYHGLRKYHLLHPPLLTYRLHTVSQLIINPFTTKSA